MEYVNETPVCFLGVNIQRFTRFGQMVYKKIELLFFPLLKHESFVQSNQIF